MIKTSEISHNVIAYTATYYDAKVKETAMIAFNKMSASIEFHSKRGFNSLDFLRYNKSQFSSDLELKIANKIFENILKENGHAII